LGILFCLEIIFLDFFWLPNGQVQNCKAMAENFYCIWIAPHPEEFVQGILCTVTAHEQGVTEISTLPRQSKGVLISVMLQAVVQHKAMLVFKFKNIFPMIYSGYLVRTQ
jgi:hypothetical protein